LPKEAMTEPGAPSPNEFSFRPFRLLREQRLLLKGEEPVRLGGRADEILAALLERPGLLVTKEELFARVWPKQFGRRAISSSTLLPFAKALGDGQDGNRFIANVPGRGCPPSRSSPRQQQAFRVPSLARRPLPFLALSGDPTRS
jgi:DNA-binding response OmpR family regulator